MKKDILASSNLFKSHIKNYSADLNAKAGRTKNEVSDIVGDQKLFKMSSNENALGPSPKAVQAIITALDTIHEYSHRVDDDFRIKLAQYHGNVFSASHFITGNSGLDIIEMIIRGFLEPGMKAIFTNPTFHVYELFTEVSGGKAINVPLLPGTFELDLEGILKAVDDHTRLLFLGNPNNPVGKIIPSDELDYLVTNLPDHVIIIHDEVYHHFVESPDYPDIKPYVLDNRPIIGVNSFSKAFGLAGLRVGYAYANEQIANYLRKLRRPFHINALSSVGAMAALDDFQHINNVTKLISKEKKWLYNELDSLGLQYWESHTNFILFRSPLPVDLLINAMLSKGVMIRSGENNGAPGCIRVTIGKHDANVVFVTNLSSFIKNN